MEGSAQTGLGATRQCNLIDGKNYIQERVVDYVLNKRMVVDIIDGTVPVRNARAEVELRPQDDSSTAVTMTMSFEPKMGFLGKLMVPLMKPQFSQVASKASGGQRGLYRKKPLAGCLRICFTMI